MLIPCYIFYHLTLSFRPIWSQVIKAVNKLELGWAKLSQAWGILKSILRYVGRRSHALVNLVGLVKQSRNTGEVQLVDVGHNLMTTGLFGG